MNEETKQPDLEKCDVCGGLPVIEENELYTVKVKDGKLIFTESYGCSVSKVTCRDCGSDLLTENDANKMEIDYEF